MQKLYNLFNFIPNDTTVLPIDRTFTCPSVFNVITDEDSSSSNTTNFSTIISSDNSEIYIIEPLQQIQNQSQHNQENSLELSRFFQNTINTCLDSARESPDNYETIRNQIQEILV